MSSSRGGAALQLPEAVPLFAALGDATRLRLLGRLSAGGPLSITRLSEGTGVTRQAITRHLYALGDVGLVRHARRGRERVWDLNRERLDRAKRYLDQISAQWDDAAARLKAFVEEDAERQSGVTTTNSFTSGKGKSQ
jgi:DNA-binding transcriptional ArsR family regulator